MARFSAFKLINNGKAIAREHFSRCIASLDSLEKMRTVFLDLFSDAEIIMFYRRIIIAKLLTQGENYNTIITQLEASRATIREVKKQLEQTNGGYGLLLRSMVDVENELSDELQHAHESLDPQSLERHLQKYSSRYAFINMERNLPKYIKYRRSGKKRKKSAGA